MTKHSPYEDAEDNYDAPVDCYDDMIEDASDPEPEDVSTYTTAMTNRSRRCSVHCQSSGQTPRVQK